MTAIALDRDFSLSATSSASLATPALRLPIAAGIARAFLVVHTPSSVAGGRSDGDGIAPLADDTDDATQAFIAELRELGGMSVIA